MRSLLGLLVLAAACAPTSKSYKPQAMLPDEGAVVGRVKVVYNGSDVTKVPAGAGRVREGDGHLALTAERCGWVFFGISAKSSAFRLIESRHSLLVVGEPTDNNSLVGNAKCPS